MIIKNLHLLAIMLITLAIIISSTLLLYIQQDDSPNFITTPKPKIVYLI